MAVTVTSLGRLRWLIVFSSFLMYLIVHSALRALPIFFVELVSVFGAGESATAWVPALQEFMFKGTGVIFAPIIKKVGCRAVAVLGCLLAALSYLIGMYSTNIVHLILSVGIMAGVGMGMMILSSLVCVQYYFDDKRALASSLAIVGNSIGTLVGSPLTRVMMKLYSWKGAMFIQAGILLNGLVASMLLQPKPVRYREAPSCDQTPTEQVPLKEIGAKQSTYNSHKTNFEKAGIDVEDQNENPNHSNGLNSKPNVVEDNEDQRSFCELLRASVTSMCSMELMYNRPFIIYILSNMFIFAGYIVPITFLPERAVVHGIGKLDASFLISIIAFSNLATRISVGFISNETVRFWVYVAISCISGVVNLLTPFYTVYWSMCMYAVILGLCHGSFLPLKVVIVVDLAGTVQLETAVAWSFACVSIPVLVGPPFAGAIIQWTGSMELPFVCAGVSQVFGAVMLLAIPIFFRSKKNYTRF